MAGTQTSIGEYSFCVHGCICPASLYFSLLRQKKSNKRKAIGKIAPQHKADASCRFPKAKLLSHVVHFLFWISFTGDARLKMKL